MQNHKQTGCRRQDGMARCWIGWTWWVGTASWSGCGAVCFAGKDDRVREGKEAVQVSLFHHSGPSSFFFGSTR